MKVLFYLFVVSFVSIDASVFEGQCRVRPATVVDPFNINRYYGIWYEIEWYDDEYATFDECLQFTYTAAPDRTSGITFDTKLFLQDSRNYTAVQTYLGVGKVFDDGKIGTAANAELLPTTANYFVLATDYLHYSFVWDCFNVNGTHYNERMWYFDRQPNPPCRPAEVENLIRKHFDERYIRKTYHGEKCKY